MDPETAPFVPSTPPMTPVNNDSRPVSPMTIEGTSDPPRQGYRNRCSGSGYTTPEPLAPSCPSNKSRVYLDYGASPWNDRGNQWVNPWRTYCPRRPLWHEALPPINFTMAPNVNQLPGRIAPASVGPAQIPRRNAQVELLPSPFPPRGPPNPEQITADIRHWYRLLRLHIWSPVASMVGISWEEAEDLCLRLGKDELVSVRVLRGIEPVGLRAI